MKTKRAILGIGAVVLFLLIAALIPKEHPQTIATGMRALASESAADTSGFLPEPGIRWPPGAAVPAATAILKKHAMPVSAFLTLDFSDTIC